MTEGIKTNDKILMAAILTTRGAAFRDLTQFKKSKDCAMKAYLLNQDSRHVCYLLCAIYYQESLFEKGDYFLKKAEALGSTPALTIQTIREAIRNADSAKKGKIKNHFLSKDPEKYQWVRYL